MKKMKNVFSRQVKLAILCDNLLMAKKNKAKNVCFRNVYWRYRSIVAI